mmetsp:Transcript_17334/g.55654  ORF Transcript_17334/g.55654 Transcript_17334/m.55654 type:complete len:218 (-) Transcript_17334:352-1005(-)
MQIHAHDSRIASLQTGNLTACGNFPHDDSAVRRSRRHQRPLFVEGHRVDFGRVRTNGVPRHARGHARDAKRAHPHSCTAAAAAYAACRRTATTEQPKEEAVLLAMPLLGLLLRLLAAATPHRHQLALEGLDLLVHLVHALHHVVLLLHEPPQQITVLCLRLHQALLGARQHSLRGCVFLLEESELGLLGAQSLLHRRLLGLDAIPLGLRRFSPSDRL